MKIVINKCYGGFGLSAIAVKRLAMIGSAVIETIPIKEWGEWASRVSKDIGDGFTDKGYGVVTDGTNVYTVDRSGYRADPDLVNIVEEMGDSADGECAELEIVEIPDGIRWEIEEYDGTEWISEAHRTWR